MNCLRMAICGLSLAGSLLAVLAQPLIQPQVLHTFVGGAPYPTGPVRGPDGALYGTSQREGLHGNGNVYRITTNGVYTSIADFWSCPDCGIPPDFAPVLAGDGKFYGGTRGTSSGYHTRSGSIYSVTTNGLLKSVTIFYQTNGGIPDTWAVGSDGLVYGTTWLPGPDNYGNVFKVSTNGDVSTLRWFSGTNEGYRLTLGSDGNFYGFGYAGFTYPGFTNGVLLRMTPDAEFTTMGFDGTNIYGMTLTLGWDGSFYGFGGGAPGDHGGIARMTTNGAFTFVASLNGTPGLDPSAPLARGDDGNFYGTTRADTISRLGEGGTVLRVTTNGILNVLAIFSKTNGAVPNDLAYGDDGNLYGTTISENGENPGSCVLFRVNIASVPPVIQSSSATNGQFTLTWSALYGRTYQPQYCTDMTVANWTNLGASVLATNSKMTTTDLTIQSSQKFYRVALLPAP